MSIPAIRLAVEQVPEQPVAATQTAADVLQGALARFERPLLGYAHCLLNDWELARDVVQDSFVRLHRELSHHEPENLKAWLFTVCRNRSLDLIRKQKRMDVTDLDVLDGMGDELPNPAEVAERRDAHQRALKFMDRLPANQREVIRLKFQADLSYKEISEVTQLSVGNVGYLLHHGLRRLRELMSEPAATGEDYID